ncbi:MAG: glycosyltransferase family 39 protein, partial [Planctomycetaceae bacterium]|nr:glycosyltransferase family 39 protein [Planctomycetaceae bacterium]
MTRDHGQRQADGPRLRWLPAGLLLTHALLVGWIAYRMTPTQDEVAHLPAGLAIWELGRTDVYCVNPPLVKAVAALPVRVAEHEVDWRPLEDVRLGPRREWALGGAFIKANGRRAWWLMMLARWACLPFALLGGWVLYRWVSDEFGAESGLVALALWCFSPNVIGYAALITPDIASVSVLLLASWRFSLWLRGGSMRDAVLAGLV